IATFWDDLVTFAGGAVYWEVKGSGTDQRLIVQWEHVQYIGFDGGTITFQAVLSEADNSIQLNYLNLTAGDPSGRDEGASATVGVKDVGNPPASRLLLAFNDGPNTSVGTGKSTRLVAVPPPSDLYSFTLDAGQSVSAVAKSLSDGDVHLRLL